MNDFLSLDRERDVAVVWIDQAEASVNTITPAALDAIGAVLDEIERDAALRSAVFISRKPDTFIAGADLRVLQSMETPADVRAMTAQGHALVRRMRTFEKPTVAAIHGAALGGGLEVALACTYRLATEHRKTKLALPEVMLGLLPGGGGTQLLPRLIGLQQALSMMLTGKNVYPRRARRLGLIDATTYRQGLLDAALDVARRLADGTLRPKRDTLGFGERLIESNPLSRRLVYQKARERVLKETKGHYPAPLEIIDCVEAGLEDGFDAGLEAEARGFAKLVFTPASRALVSLFFARQAAEKNPWKDAARPVETVGVLGAGLMGAGIAEVSAGAGMDVVVKDQKLALAAKARQHVWEKATRKVKKRILSPFERDRLAERIQPADDYAALGETDLVIEAVPEYLALKRDVLAATEAATRADAIFASNTSSIPIAEIAEASQHPETVLGMHYFSPVAQMPLLEIVRTEKTADWVLATAYEAGLRQGKTVIVVEDGPGFYTTRILGVYMNEALLLLEEGARAEDVDAAMEAFGFPMGPFALFDLVGIDVAAKITEEMRRHADEAAMKLTGAARRLADAGLLGQKSGAGFYVYEPDKRGRAQKGAFNKTVYAFFGGAERQKMEADAIQERLALLMVNEAIRCLDDGILRSPRDGDLGAVFGLGFPPFRGGPFRYTDTETAAALAARLNRLELAHGPRFAPAPTLQEQARTGTRFYE